MQGRLGNRRKAHPAPHGPARGKPYTRVSLRNQVGRDNRNKLAGGDDFGFLPELGEVARIASDQEIGSGRVSAFQKNIIARIGRDLEPAGRGNNVSVFLDELEELLPETLADVKLPVRQDRSVLRKYRRGHIPSRRFDDGQQEYAAW